MSKDHAVISASESEDALWLSKNLETLDGGWIDKEAAVICLKNLNEEEDFQAPAPCHLNQPQPLTFKE